MDTRRHLDVESADIWLERDAFFRTMLRELAGTLQDVVGLEDASGYISVVGRKIGESIGESYKAALSIDRLDRSQVASVLIDLKRRLDGDFYLVEESEGRIVLGNRACPFGDKAVGRPALCMMTSNVFGHIAAQNLGYAKVELQDTIARGDRGCRVVIHLQLDDAGRRAPGRQYFGD